MITYELITVLERKCSNAETPTIIQNCNCLKTTYNFV